MRNFSLLTEKETRRLMCGHITRAAQERRRGGREDPERGCSETRAGLAAATVQVL